MWPIDDIGMGFGWGYEPHILLFYAQETTKDTEVSLIILRK